jgi:hypothetical protein
VQVPKDEEFQDKWSGPSLPYGVVVTISFAEPYKTISGTFDVPETEKISRTIAINRTRKIDFQVIKEEDEHQDQQQQKPPDNEPKKDE